MRSDHIESLGRRRARLAVMMCCGLVAMPALWSLMSDDVTSRAGADAGKTLKSNAGRFPVAPDTRRLPLVDRSLEALAAQAPLDFLESARERCRQVRDYGCRFTKQERLNGTLREPCTYDVLYRESPRSVFMKAHNARAGARRILYVAGAYPDGAGRDTVLLEPRGLARLLTSRARIRVDDPRILARSRKTIDQYGFAATLERLITISRRAREQGVLDLRYRGPGSIDGRLTLVFERRLPYGGPQGMWPDGLAVIHLDSEWLAPVCVETYTDESQSRLIASYRSTHVSMNLGLDDRVFEF